MSYDKKRKRLEVRNLWYEPGVRQTKALQNEMDRAVRRFERFCKSGD